MNAALIYALSGVTLFVIGVAALIIHTHLLRKILAFNIMGSGTFLVLVGLAQRDGMPDPVPQAMVLTGIVVTVAATALALALARRLLDQSRKMQLPKNMALKRQVTKEKNTRDKPDV
jgi:multicomponent Na+:H+ antiporter subunit C